MPTGLAGSLQGRPRHLEHGGDVFYLLTPPPSLRPPLSGCDRSQRPVHKECAVQCGAAEEGGDGGSPRRGPSGRPRRPGAARAGAKGHSDRRLDPGATQGVPVGCAGKEEAAPPPSPRTRCPTAHDVCCPSRAGSALCPQIKPGIQSLDHPSAPSNSPPQPPPPPPFHPHTPGVRLGEKRRAPPPAER